VSFPSASKADARDDSRMCGPSPSFVPRMGKTVESGFWIVTLNSELKLGLKLAG
jgi:hypothetical protein